MKKEIIKALVEDNSSVEFFASIKEGIEAHKNEMIKSIKEAMDKKMFSDFSMETKEQRQMYLDSIANADVIDNPSVEIVDFSDEDLEDMSDEDLENLLSSLEESEEEEEEEEDEVDVEVDIEEKKK